MRPGILVGGMLPLLALAVCGRAAAQQPDDAWLSGCRHEGWGRGRAHCEVRVSTMPAPGGTLSIDGRANGGVVVRGWDGAGVRVTARVSARAGSEAEARELAGRVRVNASGSSIGAVGPEGGHDRSWSVSYEVMVPRGTDLKVETTNGGIAVHDVHGRMALNASNGGLVLNGVGGDVHAHTTNGPLRVRLAGARWQGTGLDVSTTNGPVTMTLPEGYAAHLDVSNTNGPLNLGFPVTVTGRVGHHMATDLNGGGPTIRASTVNGPVTLDRS